MKWAGSARRLPLPAILPLFLALGASSSTAGASRPAPPAKASLRGRSVEDFLRGLEANCRRVLGHLRADGSLKGEEAKQRDHVAGLLDGALASQGAPFQHAMALHKALWAAQGFLLKRTKELTSEHIRLSDEVADQQARILYAMLKQRRRLPMKSQVVLLKRKQFADCACARQLLQRHQDGEPLYKQLEALLPKQLAQELGAPKPKVKDHLAAGGSEGRVHIISSRMKNDVDKMVGELRQAHDRIAQLLAAGTVKDEEERKQAQSVMVGLEDVLRKASGTKDLRRQLDVMDEAQARLARWMKGVKA